MFFFKLYESSNLAQKLHVEEWAPTVNDALMMTMQLGMIVISACIELVTVKYQSDNMICQGVYDSECLTELRGV